MMPGTTTDKTTLTAMIALLKKRHGKVCRIWVMDRGIPTEDALAQMRACDPPMHYLVGTPKARLRRLETALAEHPWVEVRGQLRVKSVPEDGEIYVLTESPARVDKERSMRRRTLKKYWKRLGELARMKNMTRDALLLKLGHAQGEAGAFARLVTVKVAETDGRPFNRTGLCRPQHRRTDRNRNIPPEYSRSERSESTRDHRSQGLSARCLAT